MARPYKTGFSAWLRGGQTIGHTFDMILEVLKRLLIIGICWGAIVFVGINLRAADRDQEYGSLVYMAELLAFIGEPAPQQISVPTPGRQPQPYAVEQVKSLPWMKPHYEAYTRLIKLGFVLWILGIAMLMAGSTWWYSWEGNRKLKSRQLRGQEVVYAPDLAAQIREFNEQEKARTNKPQFKPAKLVGFEYPFDTEPEHTLVVGGPGSGKTVAIDRLIVSIRERGDKAIIYDPELTFIPKHFDPETDLILNPFDARSPSWSPFNDTREYVDWDRLAHGLFKDPKTGDPYWSNVARSVFSWAGFSLQTRDPEANLETLLKVLFGPLSGLQKVLKDTPAAQHVLGEAGPRVASIRSVLVDGVTPLVYLLNGTSPFSIRAWVNAPRRQPGFLFLSAPETHADTLRPLLGFWSDIAVTSLLSRNAEGVAPHPTWIVLDEFPSLGRIDRLADGPQRLRKYGGCMVFGMQQISQIEDVYGREKARTVVGQCATKLVLRANDSQTAQMLSEMLGERVVHRVTETTSYGANPIRDGVGITPKEEKEPIFLPSDIMNFPKLQGAIKFSNARANKAFPITQTKFTWLNFESNQPGYVPSVGPDPLSAFMASFGNPDGSKSSGGQGGAGGAAIVVAPLAKPELELEEGGAVRLLVPQKPEVEDAEKQTEEHVVAAADPEAGAQQDLEQDQIEPLGIAQSTPWGS